jgi:hypothetical protein
MEHNVKQLKLNDGAEPDYVDGYVEDSDDFGYLAKLIGKELGYMTVKWSDVQDSYWNEEWEHSTCIDGIDNLVWMMTEDSHYEYLIHGIAETADWVLGEDNREKAKKKQVAICLYSDSNSEVVYSEIHQIGKCPHVLYEKDVMVDRKIKITAEIYVHVKGRDKEAKIDDLVDEAISNLFSTDHVGDTFHDELSYEMDDDVEINVVRHKLNYKTVKRTRII